MNIVIKSVSLCICPPGFDALGDLLKPTVPSHNQAPPMALHHPGHPHPGHPGGKLLANDLDSSLANLVGSEYCIDNIDCSFVSSHLSVSASFSPLPPFVSAFFRFVLSPYSSCDSFLPLGLVL